MRRHGIKCYVDIMSHFDYKYKRLSKEEARKFVLKLASVGKIVFSMHAKERLLERNITQNDVINVLRSVSMRVADGEIGNVGYTYQCSTRKFAIVIGFAVSGDKLIVVTVFKIERKD